MSTREFIHRELQAVRNVAHNVAVYKFIEGEDGKLYKRLWAVFRYPNMDKDMSKFEYYFNDNSYIIQVELPNSDGVIL